MEKEWFLLRSFGAAWWNITCNKPTARKMGGEISKIFWEWIKVSYLQSAWHEIVQWKSYYWLSLCFLSSYMMDISVIYWHWTFGGDMDCVDAEILWLCLLTYFIWGDGENYKSTCPSFITSFILSDDLADRQWWTEGHCHGGCVYE